jgi:hypothetical protein
MRKLFVIFILAASLAAGNAEAQVENGCGRGLVDVPFSSTGVPLLARFGFAFNPGVDHHINQILIFPGLPLGMMRLAFMDGHPDDEDDKYCFNIQHQDLSDSRIRQVSRGVDICSEDGSCSVTLEKPAGDFVFVLTGFQLSFRADFDHHLKEVALLEDNGQLQVTFRDKHFDPSEDTFIWSLQYAYVPRDKFADIGVVSGSGANDRVLASMPAGPPLIRGFRFRFADDDHHIQQISVRPNGTGTAFISFRDVNGDDKFDWEYRWGTLASAGPPPILVPDVGGDDLKTADQVLGAASLWVGQVTEVIDRKCNNIGIVSGQAPSPGTSVQAGSAVNLFIGKKPPPPFECP